MSNLAIEQAPVQDSPESLIRLALERGTNVEVMERLLAMRNQLREQKAKEDFHRSMAAFQAECPTITKNKVAGDNRFRYRYAPLEDILRQVGPLLEKYGFSYRFDSSMEDNGESGQSFFKVRCMVNHIGGHMESNFFTVPIDKSARMNSTQQFGSASTYAKRYCFCNAFGIMTGEEDDDAASSVEPSKPENRQPEPNKVELLRKKIGANEQWLVRWLKEGMTNKEGKPIHWLSGDDTLADLSSQKAEFILSNFSVVAGKLDDFIKLKQEVGVTP